MTASLSLKREAVGLGMSAEEGGMSMRGPTPEKAEPKAVREARKRREEVRRRLVLNFCVFRVLCGLLFAFRSGADWRVRNARRALPA